MSSQARTGYVLLEDGSRFEGEVFGSQDRCSAEVVFCTAMTGYQEAVTDPSYAGQIITFTYPMIGNYGVSAASMESDRPHVNGVVLRCGRNSLDHAGAEWGWLDWLADQDVPVITGVDTRALVRRIRERGSMRGGIFTEEVGLGDAGALIEASPQMEGADLASTVTSPSPRTLDPHDGAGDPVRVVALDTGIKRSIVEQFRQRSASVTLLPCSSGPDDVRSHDPDLIFLANGPGDPAALDQVVETVRALIGEKPMVGICMGHQLLSRAVGLSTYKLTFGHRGANHPVKDTVSGRVEITSQNHGFAVSLPDGASSLDRPEAVRWETEFGEANLTHFNLYDGTVEGLHLPEANATTVQYHPEAGPGPHDSRHLFGRFLEMAEAAR